MKSATEAGRTSELALRLVLRHGLLDCELQWPDDEPMSAVEWAKFAGAARNGRIAGLVVSAVESGALPVTVGQASDVAAQHDAAMGWAISVEREAVRVAKILDGAGAPFRLLKGVALAHQLYADPSLRQFADVDLLIPADALDQAVDALVKSGVARLLPETRPGFDRRFSKGVDMRASSGVEVDVHRTLAMGWFGKMMKPDGLFNGATAAVSIGGRDLPALSLEDALVHAGMHAVLGSVEIRLSNARDIAELCLHPDVDVDAVERRADQWQCAHVLAESVVRVGETMDMELGRWTSWAKHHQPDPEQLRRIEDYDREDGKVDRILLGQVFAIDGAANRVRYVSSILAPTSENLAARGLDRRSHIRQLADGLGKALPRLAVGRSAGTTPVMGASGSDGGPG